MTELGQKEYECDKCEFKCSKKFSWNRHLLTSKHQKNIMKGEELLNEKEQCKSFTCDNCNKNYSHRQSLSIHKKKCIKTKPTEEMLLNSIIDLVKTNTELTNKLKELVEANK